jgi:hypothetical protein
MFRLLEKAGYLDYLFLRDSTELVYPPPPPLHLRSETDPVSETICFLVFRIPDNWQRVETQ